MSRFTQARRWAARSKRRSTALMTEHGITPDEAREALLTILLQTGHVLERVYDYDPARDRFKCVARSKREGKLTDCIVPGETVAKVVHVARILGNTGGKKLVRPSERCSAVQ